MLTLRERRCLRNCRWLRERGAKVGDEAIDRLDRRIPCTHQAHAGFADERIEMPAGALAKPAAAVQR